MKMTLICMKLKMDVGGSIFILMVFARLDFHTKAKDLGGRLPYEKTGDAHRKIRINLVKRPIWVWLEIYLISKSLDYNSLFRK